MTATAGMAIVSKAFEKLHIPEQLETSTADIDQDQRYSTHEILQQLIALRIVGREAIEDARMLADPSLRWMFGKIIVIRQHLPDD